MENGKYPAFPCDYNNDNQHNGLTKREYFAAMAMQGMLSNGYGDFGDEFKDHIAKLAISQADELLKQLSTKQSEV